MTNAELLAYYSNLLRLQYHGGLKNVAAIEALCTPVIMNQLPLQVQNAFNLNPTIQTLTFSGVAASGSFVLTYNGTSTPSISWNASLADIQTDLNDLLGIGQATVTGSIASKSLVVTWNINQVPNILTVTSSLSTSAPAAITIAVTTNQAVGVQLDILGMYVGVVRSGVGSAGPVTLDDASFLQLIQLAIIRNQQGSSLATIVDLLFKYFPGQIQVFDYANTSPMTMGYLINTTITNEQLLQLFIAEGLLPQPMGVGISIIAYPTTDLFFGYCDYATATSTDPKTHNSKPYNCATSYISGDYDTSWPYLDYSDAL